MPRKADGRRPGGASALLVTLAAAHSAGAQTSDTVVIRGHRFTVHLYGRRGGVPIVVSSGDGGWMHLGPHVAETLAAQGFFVVGFDVKAYLESFTSGNDTLRPEDEPGDYKVIADFAAASAATDGQKPILDRRLRRRRPVGACGNGSAHQDGDRGRDRPGPARPQRAGMALEGRARST